MSVTSDQNEPFRSMVRASGLGEVWTHTHDQEKFKQFGWRCTTKENSYGNDTLIGNWNEEKFDLQNRKHSRKLPSQFAHYFDSTYDASYNTTPYEVPKELKHLKARHPHAFPGHSPETDSEQQKVECNSWETTTRASYVDPTIRKSPLTSAKPETAK